MEEFKVKTIDATDFLKTGTECLQRTIYDRNKEDKEDKERESRRPLNINLTINFTNQKADNLVNVHQNTGDIDIAQQHTWVEQPVEPAEEVFEELNLQPEGEECGMVIEENYAVKSEVETKELKGASLLKSLYDMTDGEHRKRLYAMLVVIDAYSLGAYKDIEVIKAAMSYVSNTECNKYKVALSKMKKEFVGFNTDFKFWPDAVDQTVASICSKLGAWLEEHGHKYRFEP